MDPFVLLLLLFVLRGQVYAEDPDVIVRPGDDVPLTCRSAHHHLAAVQWTRTDLRSEHVFLSIDGHVRAENQHPSFKDRVQLVDGDPKHGDASLTLKNVSSSDEGTYECRVRVDDSTRRKRFILDDEPISRVRLKVTGLHQRVMKGGDEKDGDEKDGDEKGGANTGMYVGSAAAVSLVVLCFVIVFGKYRRRLKDKYNKLMTKQSELWSNPTSSLELTSLNRDKHTNTLPAV